MMVTLLETDGKVVNGDVGADVDGAPHVAYDCDVAGIDVVANESLKLLLLMLLILLMLILVALMV